MVEHNQVLCNFRAFKYQLNRCQLSTSLVEQQEYYLSNGCSHRWRYPCFHSHSPSMHVSLLYQTCEHNLHSLRKCQRLSYTKKCPLLASMQVIGALALGGVRLSMRVLGPLGLGGVRLRGQGLLALGRLLLKLGALFQFYFIELIQFLREVIRLKQANQKRCSIYS